jgi:hypothetical protein
MAFPPRTTIRRAAFLPTIAFLIVLPMSACREATGPGSRKTAVTAIAGDSQFGTPNTTLDDPLSVLVRDADTGDAVEGITVQWRVSSGTATLTAATSITDSRGIASTTVRLGGTVGMTEISVSADRATGTLPKFRAFTVRVPSIATILPLNVRAGDTMTITGTDFGDHVGGDFSPGLAVLIDGMSAPIIVGSNELIRAIAPPCVANNSAATVIVRRGAVASDAASMTTLAGDTEPLRLARGAVRVFSDASNFGCLRLPPDPAGASYMVIPQNAADTYSVEMPFELNALGVFPNILVASRSASYASEWELRLRARERALVASGSTGTVIPPASIRSSATHRIPVVGEQRSFNTLNAQNGVVKITAEVRAVTARAILYQDVAAPDIFSAADYEHFGELFDDPIYNTDTSVFGSVSDIDNNDRVIIVLTPQVNRLTPKGSASFIAGYFYACDLLSRDRCSASNGGEIFYSMVPDPTGQFGNVFSAAAILRNVPPVIAHEFMHMINFSRRGTIDELWLAEALAHTAEDIVGQVFADRGDAQTAADFMESNHSNARRYLTNVSGTSLIANESPGTIELRGAGWLFLRYLRGLYGGTQLLNQLTGGTEYGVQNVVARVGKPWATLMSDFAVALYADDAPELDGVQLEPRYTFTDLDMRAVFGAGAFYPLAVHSHTYDNFAVAGELPSSSWQYEYVQAPALPSGTSLNVAFTERYGGTFKVGVTPQLTVLRVK